MKKNKIKNNDLISRKQAIKEIKYYYDNYDFTYRGNSDNLFEELGFSDKPFDNMVKGRQFGLEEAWRIIESLPGENN